MKCDLPDRILLLTKDALCKEYLPIYGNKYWVGKTPNIDELASKGTVFHRHYTAAPSTVMAFRSMMFGRFAHETPYSDYVPMEIPQPPDSFFSISGNLGYSNHLIWDKTWDHMVLRYGNMFGGNVEIHNLEGLNQPVGPHCKGNEGLVNNDELAKATLAFLEDSVAEICAGQEKICVWIHLPHVIMGRTGYGGDMDVFDDAVGMLRRYFPDEGIYVSADHGNMDGYHGQFSYGFHVYTPAIEIPLITPRLNGMGNYCQNTSNVDIKRIVFEGTIPTREFIYSDCAYYAQPHRKLAIIKDDFAYIYNKKGSSEELYDLEFDRFERCNMINDSFLDEDRRLRTITKEVYFSPKWNEAAEMKEVFRAEKNRIWKEPSAAMAARGNALAFAKKIFVVVKKAAIGK